MNRQYMNKKIVYENKSINIKQPAIIDKNKVIVSMHNHQIHSYNLIVYRIQA